MKKLLALLMLLVLGACESTETTPILSSACILQEVTSQIKSPVGTIINKYNYNNVTGNPTRLERYKDGKVLTSVNNIYSAEGKLNLQEVYNANNTLTETYRYEYSANGLLSRMVFSTLRDGQLIELYELFYEFVSATQLKKVTHHVIPYDQTTYNTFEYKDGLMQKVLYYNINGHLDATLELEYDDQKHFTYQDKIIRNIGAGYIGFPFKHNITQFKALDSAGNLTIQSYSAVYEYNEAGYPVKEVRDYFVERSKEIYSYTYQCR